MAAGPFKPVLCFANRRPNVSRAGMNSSGSSDERHTPAATLVIRRQTAVSDYKTMGL